MSKITNLSKGINKPFGRAISISSTTNHLLPVFENQTLFVKTIFFGFYRSMILTSTP